jgi:hypothetical protein
MMILGEIGGILGILQSAFMIILSPFVSFSFKIKAFKRFYLANTIRDDLLKSS